MCRRQRCSSKSYPVITAYSIQDSGLLSMSIYSVHHACTTSRYVLHSAPCCGSNSPCTRGRGYHRRASSHAGSPVAQCSAAQWAPTIYKNSTRAAHRNLVVHDCCRVGTTHAALRGEVDSLGSEALEGGLGLRLLHFVDGLDCLPIQSLPALGDLIVAHQLLRVPFLVPRSEQIVAYLLEKMLHSTHTTWLTIPLTRSRSM